MATADILIGLVIGIAIGAGGYALHADSKASPTTPEARANILYECSSNATDYECTFFNAGKGLGAMCVRVAFKRTQESEKYLKSAEEASIAGNQVCSGMLTQGQNSLVKGKGFFGGATGTTGADFCSLKGTPSPLAGCEMTTRVVAQTS